MFGLIMSVVLIALYFTSRVNMPELLIASALFYIGYRINSFRKMRVLGTIDTNEMNYEKENDN